jgi:nicotinate-nucleotide--dimethylbenzimidazole phosphoribosyltransferase
MMVEELVADLLEDVPGPDEPARLAVRDRASRVLRPAGALARMDEVAVWLAGWQRTTTPEVRAPAATIFVADHGVAVEGVSAYPANVTGQMLEALRSGAATATVMARRAGVHLQVVDVGVGRPTGNIAVEPALTAEGFVRCFEAGRRAVARLRTDLLVLGEMGIGNTTPAAAVSTGLFGPPAEDWTGRGTGVDDDGWARKVAVVDSAARRLETDSGPIEILRQLGGAELAAVAGGTVEARRRSIPVLLDGFGVTASVAPLEVLRPGALEHCLAGHCSAEPGHELLLSKLGMEPLLRLSLRLGEGSGALAAVPLVRLAAACVTDVATFEERGITGP